MGRRRSRTLTVARPEVVAFGGGLEGAERTSRETMLWNPSRLSPDQILNGLGGSGGGLFGAKAEADLRGRDVVTNDGYAQGIVDINRDSIVGSQYRLNAQPNWAVLQSISKSFDEVWATEYQEVLEEKFNLIADSSSCWLDASRQLTFTGLVRMAVAGFVYTGEVLSTGEWIREVDRPFSTAVQMISPARLSNPMGQIESRTLRNGVQRDDRGKSLGFWIRRAYPTEFYDPNAFQWDLVPAQKPWGRKMVIHIKDAIQPSQTRGVAAMVAVLKQMRMTKRFQEVVLQNAVINASYAATIESELPSEVVAAAMNGGTAGDITQGFTGFIGAYLQSLQSYLSQSNSIAVDGAKMPHLFPGTKLNAKTLGTPGGVGTEFETSLLRHTAAGLGISYEEFANDFSKTNYSSGKLASLKTQKHMMSRKKFVADRFANDLFSLWLEEDLNAGNLPLPRGWDSRIFYQPWGKEALTACDWIGASWGQVDELKETQAALLRIQGGLSTRESEIAKMGGDYRKVFRQLSRELKLSDSLGLDFSQATADKAGLNPSTQGQTGPTQSDTTNTVFETIVEAMKSQPAPIVNVAAPVVNIAAPIVNSPDPPANRGERTVVTKHDAQGRILEFERVPL
jgi:lambda family phage portal protein